MAQVGWGRKSLLGSKQTKQTKNQYNNTLQLSVECYGSCIVKRIVGWHKKRMGLCHCWNEWSHHISILVLYSLSASQLYFSCFARYSPKGSSVVLVSEAELNGEMSMCVCVWVCVCEMSCVCVCVSSSCIQLFVILWTVTSQAPLSIEFSRQEYWNRLLFPSPVDLPNPEIKLESPISPALQADSLTAEPSGKPVKCHGKHQLFYIFTYFYFFVHTVLVYGATF